AAGAAEPLQVRPIAIVDAGKPQPAGAGDLRRYAERVLRESPEGRGRGRGQHCNRNISEHTGLARRQTRARCIIRSHVRAKLMPNAGGSKGLPDHVAGLERRADPKTDATDVAVDSIQLQRSLESVVDVGPRGTGGYIIERVDRSARDDDPSR